MFKFQTTATKADLEVIETARRLFPHAERHVRESIKRNIAKLIDKPGDREARFWLHTDINATRYINRVKKYGTD